MPSMKACLIAVSLLLSGLAFDAGATTPPSSVGLKGLLTGGDIGPWTQLKVRSFCRRPTWTRWLVGLQLDCM